MKSHRSLHSSYVQDDKQRIHLPNIHERRSVNGDEYYENPFYVPPDEEVFKLKSKEKEMRELEKSKSQSLKIWQKGIKHNSEGKLRKIRELINFDDEDNEDEKEGKLNIIDAAKSAIKNRIRHKEPLLNFLNKKKEMFLFQMTINDKKEQIKEFEELAYLQEISLQNSKDLLEKDSEVFKQYVEKSKNETRQAIKNAEDETKEKQKKIHKMKQIQEELAALMSKNTKELERLEKFYGYKMFLDKLTPDEFLKNQKKLKEARKRSRSMTTDKEKGKQEVKWQGYNLNLSQGVLDVLRDSDDEGDMYFKKPDQLQEFFENLEEKNLFIIKHNQDIEQSIEDFKHNFEAKQKVLLEKQGQLKKNKQELEDVIQQRINGINELHVKDDKHTEKTLSKLEDAIKRIYDKMKIPKDGKLESGIDILAHLERKLEVQLKEIKQFKPQKVLDQYRVCQNKHREEANEQKKKEILEDEKKKMEIIKKRAMAQKRYGRPIMAKSMLKKEDKEEVIDNEENEEELEKKLYYTVRFQ